MADRLYGINPVREALAAAGRRASELWVGDALQNARIEELVQLAERLDIPVRACDKAELERLAGHGRHQGVVLLLQKFKYLPYDDLLARWRESGRAAFFLLLDGITDPHNFGAILRSAEVAGCHGVITAKDRSCPVSAVVEKTAAGALSHLPVCQVTNLSRTIENLKQAGIWCYGLAGDSAADNLYTAELTDDVALVVGSEGKGLRTNIRRHCDRLLAIPMRGRIGSLNASVAAGIALFEIVRQKELK